MSRTTPINAQGEDDASPVDSGWSTVPPPTAELSSAAALAVELPAESEPATQRMEQSGAHARPAQGRAHGTLLGVAPPVPPRVSPPRVRSPVFVRSGTAPVAEVPVAEVPVSGRDVVSADPGSAGDRNQAPPTDALPVPTAPPVSKRPSVRPPLPPVRAVEVEVVAPLPVAAPAKILPPLELQGSPALTAPVATHASLVPHRVEPSTLGAALGCRVRVLGAVLPFWALLTPPALLFSAAVAVGAISGAARWRAPTPHAQSAASNAEPSSATAPGLALPIDAPNPERRPTSSSVEEVMALATAAAAKDRQTAKTLREKLAADPSAIKNKAVLAELRKLTTDPDSAPQALAAMAELPGSLSADLLYEVWTGTPSRTDVTELARALLHSSDVRAKASPALSVALDLRAAESCEQNLALLPRAVAEGDKRSLHLLGKLVRKQGCGAGKRQDCYACLRAGEELDSAIKAVKGRRAPTPFEAP